jgi:uncharacterized repeat protein (TIGR01451 family)
VLSSASLDNMSIGVRFDEAVDPSTAVDLFNYAFTEGSLTVTGIVLRADGQSVNLQLDGPLPPTAELVINGVLDLAGNLMDGASVLPLRHGLTAQDIGGPGRAGSHFTADGDIELVGGGTDIWGNADMAYLAHRSITGDFDARVRVKSLVGSDPVTKASLMIRETIAGGSRAINVNVNPPNGRNHFEPGQRLTTGGPTAAWGASIVPAGVPNAWLRITRTGNNWAGYHSTNGVDWTLAAQATDVYPSTVVLGLAVTAHNNTLLSTGVFSGFTVSQPQADVAITKLDAPDPVYVGGNVTYTIVVTNAGPGTATAAVVTDVLPAATTFVSANSSQGTCVNNAGTVTCNLGTLNAGGSATITIVVTAPTVGTNSNTATVTSASADPDAANNTATATTRVIGRPSVTGTTYAGGTFGASFQSEAGYTYEVRYKNNLQDAVWTLLTTIPGDGTVKSFSDPDAGTQPHRFYIIIVP